MTHRLYPQILRNDGRKSTLLHLGGHVQRIKFLDRAVRQRIQNQVEMGIHWNRRDTFSGIFSKDMKSSN